MRKIVLFVVLLALAVGGWYFGSPWLAMKNVADAAEARNTAELEAAIDFPALRENTRAQLDGAIAPTGNGLLDGIGGAILGSVGDVALDALLTPEGMVAIITTGAVASPLLPPELRNRELSWSVEREGLSRFRGVSTYDDDGAPGPVLVFERRGLGWQVVAMTITT
ncbi:MAG: hypothetical protein B7Y88_02445 [Sphingomonadales bacterium 32-64-17]|nr:MAG: hypothetical protein B7Y88_02445 [Sphingomonadales bacterium 32-64-17]